MPREVDQDIDAVVEYLLRQLRCRKAPDGAPFIRLLAQARRDFVLAVGRGIANHVNGSGVALLEQRQQELRHDVSLEIRGDEADAQPSLRVAIAPGKIEVRGM